MRAKKLKYENSHWKKYGTGVLRLYRHKVTKKQKLVLRNEIGKIQLNLAIGKGMAFTKEVKNGKKGVAAYVRFMAVEDPKKGVENFMLQVKPEDVDKLHSVLEGMVA